MVRAAKKPKKSWCRLQQSAGGELSTTPLVGMKVNALYYAKPKLANADVQEYANKYHPGTITALDLLASPPVATITYDDESVEPDVVFTSLKVYS